MSPLHEVRLAIVKLLSTMVELHGLTGLDEDLHCCANRVDVVICIHAYESVVYGLSSIAESMAKVILRRCTSLKRARSMLNLTTTIANNVNDF